MDNEQNAGTAVASTGLLGYKLVCAHKTDDLQESVRNCIKAGFVPLGAPVYCPSNRYHGVIVQAMTFTPNNVLSVSGERKETNDQQ